MNVLLIGGGGREHALARAIQQSQAVDKLFAAPGNPGIAALAECVVLNITDHVAVADFCHLMNVGLVVVGPEQPLVDGLVDDLTEAGIPAFGPSAAAARLEGSKAFTKELCDAASIPTAAWARFSDRDAALAYVRSNDAPIVVKADGLAAGKGVTVAMTLEEAEIALDTIFADAGATVVVEEYLTGEEASVFCICDGEDVIALPPCQDHKRIGEGDTGPNTGGMGALCPAPVVTQEVLDRTITEIVKPTLAEMVRRGTPFRGVLYAGLMIENGKPKVIEYNVRFGDPEAQVLAPLLGSKLFDLMQAAANGRLAEHVVPHVVKAALCVTLAAEGYPGPPRKGDPIEGVADASALDETLIFHAGTAEDNGKLVTNGGRVLTVTGLGDTLTEARDRAYRAVDLVSWNGMQVRRDIGHRTLASQG